MQFGFGLITCQRHPADTRSDADIYEEAIKLSVLAERLGFDSVWTSEHHFLDDGYAPSLLVLSAAIAHATERIQIGTGVLLAPLYHPLRLAEDAATVDVISRGRLVLGLGSGWRAEEFDLLGASLSDRGRSMRETIGILKGAWGEGTFTHRGRLWSYESVSVTPKPHRPIPIWLGGSAPAAVRRAGRLADGFLATSSATSGVGAFTAIRDAALEAAAEAGRSTAEFTFALHVPVFVWDEAPAWDIVAPWYHYLRWKYPDMAASRGRPGPPASPPPLDDRTAQGLRASIICGTPDQVVSEIASYRDALGPDLHFVCRSYFAGMPYDQQSHSLQLLGEQVLPELS